MLGLGALKVAARAPSPRFAAAEQRASLEDALARLRPKVTPGARELVASVVQNAAEHVCAAAGSQDDDCFLGGGSASHAAWHADALAAQLHGPAETEVKRLALVTLGRSGASAESQMSVVAAHLHDRSQKFRQAGHVADPCEYGGGGASAPQDGEFEVRQASARALQQIGREAAPCASDLAVALHDRSRGVRKAADHALDAVGEGAGEELVRGLRDRHPRIRMASAHALGALRANTVPHAEALTDALLNDSRREVRQAAFEALEAFGPAVVPQRAESAMKHWRASSERRRHLQLRHLAAWDKPSAHRALARGSQPGGAHTGICRYPAGRCTCRRPTPLSGI